MIGAMRTLRYVAIPACTALVASVTIPPDA
jgi:hypothetical protein